MDTTARDDLVGGRQGPKWRDVRESPVAPRLVLCFDGPCGLCTRAVAWLHARDRHGRIWFAPLQGEFAKPFRGAARGTRPDEGGFATVLLVETTPEGTSVHARSRAIARALRALGGAWGVVGAMLERVPRRVADAAYDAVGRRRWMLGGASCDAAAMGSRLLP